MREICALCNFIQRDEKSRKLKNDRTKINTMAGIKITVGTLQLRHRCTGFNLMENILSLHHHVPKRIRCATVEKETNGSLSKLSWINFSPLDGPLTV